MSRVTPAQFSVKYDGPAISDENAIDAAVFGGSLIALSDLIQESQDITTPDGPRYRVRVLNTGEGSFEVFLEIAEFWDSVKGLFTSEDTRAIATMISRRN